MYKYIFYLYTIYKINNYISIIDNVIYTSKGIISIRDWLFKENKRQNIYDDIDWVLISE